MVTAKPSSPRYRNPSVKPRWYRERQRSLTRSQRRAEAALWPLLGLTWHYGEFIDLEAAFAPRLPPPTRVLEIGCGGGEAILELAAARRADEFVGIDWFRAGLATTLQGVSEQGLEKIRLVRGDAATFLSEALPPVPTFDEVLVFFPDPWSSSPERRLVRPSVVSALSARMRPGGCLRLATDVEGYPDHARAAFLEVGGWREVPCEWLEAQRPGHARPSTRYAREAVAAGRECRDLCFVTDSDSHSGSTQLNRHQERGEDHGSDIARSSGEACA